MKDYTMKLKEIVLEASKLINDNILIKTKGDKGDDLVTNFDYEIEKFIIDKLKTFYPSFEILSEEFNANACPAKDYFVIDPIDGTINFANNMPIWAIQIAMVKNNKTISAIIYAPEFNQLFYADEDGAYCNDKKINVSEKNYQKCIYGGGYLSDAKKLVEMGISDRYLRLLHCASLSYAWVASGILGGAFFYKINKWDYLPGFYIIEKAGGQTLIKNGWLIAGNKSFIDASKKMW